MAAAAVVRTPGVRLGYRVADSIIERDIEGRTLGEDDYDWLLTGGPLMVRSPEGAPVACYLPGVLKGVMAEVDAYRLLHPLHTMMTNNRGKASGTRRIARGDGDGTRSDSVSMSSPTIGSADPGSVYRYCRMTEWTGAHLPEWEALAPLFRVIASHLEERVPERYNAQMEYVRKTNEAWVVPGTPFTTITVNNSYSTGVHKDQGDLEAGFSTLACVRRGEYSGGVLVMPQYRFGVDMQDGDLLLMDAHQWHGNTRMTCACGERIFNRFCGVCGAERISLVCYYRTRMAECGSPADELERAQVNTEKRSQPRVGQDIIDAAASVMPIPIANPDPAPDDGGASIATVPAAPIVDELEAPAKRRGRPKKQVGVLDVEVEVEAAKPEPVVKRRGRPRKVAEPDKIAVAKADLMKFDPVTGEPLE
jgi:hypothetical protein